MAASDTLRLAIPPNSAVKTGSTRLTWLCIKQIVLCYWAVLCHSIFLEGKGRRGVVFVLHFEIALFCFFFFFFLNEISVMLFVLWTKTSAVVWVTWVKKSKLVIYNVLQSSLHSVKLHCSYNYNHNNCLIMGSACNQSILTAYVYHFYPLFIVWSLCFSACTHTHTANKLQMRLSTV